ncbi:MAG: hypothetical protein GYA36_22165 [Veillonellaceae bacterium]|nr:hypothetical protein [Veillonellaceae bacterium]
MKKILIPFFSLVLVFSLLVSVTGTAAALPPPPPPPATPDLPEPVVTPVSGDMEFTTEFIPIVQFPGTTEFNQMLVPVGFPAGEAQFEGDGVIVTGMDSGKATACFYITGTQYGWGGKVGLWDGTKWVKLATTITPIEESNKSLACATITGDGTYAFIRYVVNASLLPVVSKPNCGTLGGIIILSISNSSGDGGLTWFNFGGTFSQNPNSWVSYRIINATPGITGDLFAQVPSDASGNFNFLAYDWYMPYGGYFTLHVETPYCFIDLMLGDDS